VVADYLLNNRNNEILIYPGSPLFISLEKLNSRDASMIASIWAPIVRLCSY
jgi:hypothetical protein